MVISPAGMSSFCRLSFFLFFFFNDTATPEIYTLSLHDALPISRLRLRRRSLRAGQARRADVRRLSLDRKSTRLNSSHGYLSDAVFCLKKKHDIASRAVDNLVTVVLTAPGNPPCRH